MRAWLVASAALVLASCGGAAEEEAPAPEPAPAPTFDAGPRTLVAADLDLDSLGARIEGPEGNEVESEIPGLGTMVSFVACPAAVEAPECDPDVLPEGTVYTYVHRVTLDTPAGKQDDKRAGGATLFRTTQAAAGFANVIGFSREQAEQVLGANGDIKVQLDGGRLVWRIAAGDGWVPGETLTFFWRSTLPPVGPQEAFRLEGEGLSGMATGPFPQELPVDETPPRS